MYVIYQGKEYKCDIEDENTISIYSSSLHEGFSNFMGVYYKDVLFKDCTRVYKKHYVSNIITIVSLFVKKRKIWFYLKQDRGLMI